MSKSAAELLDYMEDRAPITEDNWTYYGIGEEEHHAILAILRREASRNDDDWIDPVECPLCEGVGRVERSSAEVSRGE